MNNANILFNNIQSIFKQFTHSHKHYQEIIILRDNVSIIITKIDNFYILLNTF